MIMLVAAGLFVGYVLVYAAVGEGGKYVYAPWDALKGT